MKSFIPYISQCETAELSDKIFAPGGDPGIDPNWANSGATTLEEYSFWVKNICGITCLSMILRAEDIEIIRLVKTAKEALEYGAFVIESPEIKGLFYEPFCRYIYDRFNLKGEIIRDGLGFSKIQELIEQNKYVIASVSSQIRFASQQPHLKPITQGGHLILITSLSKNGIFYHDPSGLYGQSQENAFLGIDRFNDFFAGRGMAITPN